jgi:hypothetical protein
MASRILCIAFFGFSTLSFAAGLSLRGFSQVGIKSSNSSAYLACTNFEGNWQGKCVVNGKSESSETVITQADCTSISFNDQNYPVGQDIITQNETDRDTVRLDWDANFNVIQYSAKFESKNATDPDTSFKTFGTGTGSLEILNGELISKFILTANSTPNGGSSTQSEICTYKKM